jgi:hypothetical protein
MKVTLSDPPPQARSGCLISSKRRLEALFQVVCIQPGRKIDDRSRRVGYRHPLVDPNIHGKDERRSMSLYPWRGRCQSSIRRQVYGRGQPIDQPPVDRGAFV